MPGPAICSEEQENFRIAAISLNLEKKPGARTVSRIKNVITEKQAVFLFSEP